MQKARSQLLLNPRLYNCEANSRLREKFGYVREDEPSYHVGHVGNMDVRDVRDRYERFHLQRQGSGLEIHHTDAVGNLTYSKSLQCRYHQPDDHALEDLNTLFSPSLIRRALRCRLNGKLVVRETSC